MGHLATQNTNRLITPKASNLAFTLNVNKMALSKTTTTKTFGKSRRRKFGSAHSDIEDPTDGKPKLYVGRSLKNSLGLKEDH